MASAGTVTVDFAAQTARFESDLKKVQGSLSKMESGFLSVGKVAKTALGFFSVTALASYAKSAFEAADATATAADRAGIAVESFSRLQFAAGQTDTEMGALTTGIQKLQVALSEASSGSKTAQVIFARFGLEAEKLRSLSVEDQLGAVAEAFQRITDPASRTRLAVELFGRAAGPQLVPFLAQGREGIAKFTAQADDLGITLDRDTAAAIDRTDQAVKRLTATLSAYTAKFVGGLSIAILGDPNELRRIDKELLSLTLERTKILSGDIEGLRVGTKGWQTALENVEAQIDKLLTKQRQIVADSRKPILAGTNVAVEDPVSEVDISATSALKISIDELAEAYRQLFIATQAVKDQRVSDALEISTGLAENQQKQIQQQITDDLQSQLEERNQMSNYYREQELALEQAAANSMVSMRIGALNAVQSALQSFAGQSEKAAKALILIEKARALFQAFVNTKAAITLQLSSGDPYTAVARAAAVGAFGALQIAAIAASGYGQLKSVGSGGAPIGHPANPITTQISSTEDDGGATARNTVTIQINGHWFSTRETEAWLVNTIQEAVDDRDVVLISRTSRNASELLDA